MAFIWANPTVKGRGAVASIPESRRTMSGKSNLEDLIGFQLIRLPGNLRGKTGEFWELKFTLLNTAEVRKH